MPKLDEPRDEALRRLTERAAALGARTAPPAKSHAAEQATSQAYRIIAELLGGVLIGLGAGFIVDRILRTAPWGLIAGVLLGFALSIWMARRTANRLMRLAREEQTGPASPVPFDDDDDEE